MKKIFILALAVWIAAAGFSSAELFNIQNIDYGKANLKAIDKATGNVLWQCVLNVQRGNGFVFSEEKGEGIWGKDRAYKTWDSRAYFKLEGTRLIPYQIEIVIRDKNGKIVQSTRKTYDLKNQTVYCIFNGRSKVINFDDDLIDKEQMGVCVSNYDFEAKKDMVFHLLTNEPTRYKMTLKYLGAETVDNVACHKLQLIPDLGALNVIGAFVPKTYFWMEAAPPHDFVRYEGLESGLGTPYIVMEKSR